jgi:hypothetical protein
MTVDLLATTTLTNPLVVQMRQDVADAMHNARPGFLADSKVLTEAIADITFDLTIQGASFIEVKIIDPAWQLLKEGPNGSFIDVDSDGFLLPITIEFPKGSDRWYYLVAASPTSDLTSGNLTLTFEDRAVDVLRNLDQYDGPAQSLPNETRLEFLIRLLKVGQITPKEIFSQATINFEQSPPSFTPAQVVQWDRAWTQTRQQRQQQASQLQSEAQKGVNAAASTINQVVQGITNLFGGPPPATGTNARNQWWATNAPGAEDSGSADYVPNAGYIPGL